MVFEARSILRPWRDLALYCLENAAEVWLVATDLENHAASRKQTEESAAEMQNSLQDGRLFFCPASYTPLQTYELLSLRKLALLALNSSTISLILNLHLPQRRRPRESMSPFSPILP